MNGKIIEIRGPFHEWNPPHTVFCAWQLRVRYRVDKREIWLATHCHPAKKGCVGAFFTGVWIPVEVGTREGARVLHLA
ncbi:hypothetical protein CSPX01_12804 [Colletotrichum filicis]|nr:hypothetical protein CSPX01_12804 [Colletotrichum filicis]